MNYDIIGDIHGRYDKLMPMLRKLGYRPHGRYDWIPPAGHTALFLGDLIDPKHGHHLLGGVKNTLETVYAMQTNGHALCLLGNHELNAIYYHSQDATGQWMRVHGSNNNAMHQGTLNDFPDYQKNQSQWQTHWLPWLKQLPFWLELDGMRAVHAAWHTEHVNLLAGMTLTDEKFFAAASTQKTPEGKALETLLKGIEVPLPMGVHYHDHGGIQRRKIRARWWEQPTPGIRYHQLRFSHDDIPDDLVCENDLHHIPGYPLDAPPVFFGHYLKAANSPLHPERSNVACLDHAAATNGPLVAYRWQGEAIIRPKHYLPHN